MVRDRGPWKTGTHPLNHPPARLIETVSCLFYDQKYTDPFHVYLQKKKTRSSAETLCVRRPSPITWFGEQSLENMSPPPSCGEWSTWPPDDPTTSPPNPCRPTCCVKPPKRHSLMGRCVKAEEQGPLCLFRKQSLFAVFCIGTTFCCVCVNLHWTVGAACPSSQTITLPLSLSTTRTRDRRRARIWSGGFELRVGLYVRIRERKHATVCFFLRNPPPPVKNTKLDNLSGSGAIVSQAEVLGSAPAANNGGHAEALALSRGVQYCVVLVLTLCLTVLNTMILPPVCPRWSLFMNHRFSCAEAPQTLALFYSKIKT